MNEVLSVYLIQKNFSFKNTTFDIKNDKQKFIILFSKRNK